MKISQLILALVIGCSFIACNINSDGIPAGQQKVLLKASGLVEPVHLQETIHGGTFTINQDGNYNLLVDEGLYHFEIVDDGEQTCQINLSADLTCAQTSCTADYTPVCGKQPFVNVCVTEPCETDVYATFGNACNAAADNAWIAIQGECQALESVSALHQKPALITSLALLDYASDPFTVVSSQISDDTLTIVLAVSGGCGTHEATLYVDNMSNDSVSPPRFATAIAYQHRDDCNDSIQITEKFDLLPVKETYRRLHPDTSGTVIVTLNDLGNYQMTL